jgi:hypothetical protein
MGLAMSLTSPQQGYDVDLDNGAIIGCGVVRSAEYLGHGVVGDTTTACNSGAPTSQQWPAQWAANLAAYHPGVTVLLAGRWEVTDLMIGGRWLHIGQPAFDVVLKQSLEQAVRLGTADGELMILLTAPCFSSGEQPNGQPWPEDSATRLAEYNAILRQVAAEHPQTVEVVDFGAMLCPGGQFQTDLDGVQIRDADGVHIVPTAGAGSWLDARLLPEIVRLGRLHQAGQTLSTAPTTPTTVAPVTSVP